MPLLPRPLLALMATMESMLMSLVPEKAMSTLMSMLTVMTTTTAVDVVETRSISILTSQLMSVERLKPLKGPVRLLLRSLLKK